MAAAAVVALALGVAAWVQAHAGSAPPGPGRQPPFAPGRMVAETGGGAAFDFVLVGPGAVLYVDDACLFCAAEVRAWHAVMGDDAPAWLTVIRHPAPGVAHPGVVPAAWASRTLVDPGGAVGARLGVTAVPYLALTDSSGTVVQVTLGITPAARIRTLLETFANDPRPTIPGRGAGARP